MTSRQATLLALGHAALVVVALLVLCLSGCDAEATRGDPWFWIAAVFIVDMALRMLRVWRTRRSGRWS